MNDQAQLEQQLLAATSRRLRGNVDGETESLHQAYVSLANLLEHQNHEVDEATLIAGVLADQRPLAAAGDGKRSEAWLAMAALAASVLLMVSLAATQFARPQGVKSHNDAVETVDFDPQLAWDDHWDSWLDDVSDSAAAYRLAGFTRFEATAWSASEARREIDEELNSL